jgi:hypothetical protein
MPNISPNSRPAQVWNGTEWVPIAGVQPNYEFGSAIPTHAAKEGSVYFRLNGDLNQILGLYIVLNGTWLGFKQVFDVENFTWNDLIS